MKAPSPIVSILSRQRMEGKLAFAFVRASPPRGGKGSPDSWAALLPKGAPILRMCIPPSGGVRPYQPLLDIIRERALLLPQAARDALLSSIPVHRRHPAILRDWLATGSAEREDDLFRPLPEYEFERGRLFQSLAAMIERLWAETDVTVLIEGFQNAGPSLAAFILFMIRQGCRGRLSFICASSGESGSGTLWPQGLRHDFFLEMERRDLIIYRPLKLKPWRAPPPEPEAAACGLRDINLARSFLAHEEAPSCDFVAALSPEEAARARVSLGHMLLQLGDPSAALTQFQTALEEAYHRADPRKAARIEASIAVCHAAREEPAERDRWISRARVTISGIDDPDLSLHVDYIRCRLQDKFTSDPANATLVRTLEERLERKGREDLLLGLRSMIPYYEGVMSQRGWDEACAEARAALARAECLDCAYQASAIHNILGYLHQLRGRGSEAMEHFDQCIEIRRSLGDEDGLVQVNNGAGYLAFIIGNFPRALAAFSDSLKVLSERSAHAESCLTLFNIAWVCFFAGSFGEASGLMGTVLGAMEDLGLASLPFHSRKDLLSFAGAASFLSGGLSAALGFLETARSLPDDPADGLMVPLLEALSAGLADDAQKEDEAYARTALLAERDGRGCLRSFAEALRGWRALARRYAAEAQRRWEGARAALSGDFPEFSALLSHLRSGGQPKAFKPLLLPGDRVRFLSARLASSAAQEACNRRIRRRMDSLSFLDDFEKAMEGSEGERALVSAAVELLFRFFRVESVSVLENRFAPSILESRPAMQRPGPSWTWGRLFGMGDAPGLKSLSLPEGRLMAYPFRHRDQSGLWAVVSVAPGASQPFGDDENAIALALGRLDMALQLDATKRDLGEARARDRLTGLLSRAEFQKRMDLERQRYGRYQSEERGGFALVLMDLDAFRKCNEAFGEGGGDLILKAVARTALLCIRELDSLGRWEADRFSLLLPCTGLEGGLLAAGRILAALQAAAEIARDLGGFLGREVPADWRPSCSFGAAAWSPESGGGPDALLARAEAALREAKAAGGNAVRGGA